MCFVRDVRPGKQVWEKRYVVLRDNHVLVLEREQTGHGRPLQSFDLCPPDGSVSVHGAVTAAELTNTAATDLPYIIRSVCAAGVWLLVCLVMYIFMRLCTRRYM